ncbi:MAG: sugar ABC transporter permease [Burkholderiales bacterium]|nr:sugar ABC transporter permease [Burkholderiales bacterium]
MTAAAARLGRDRAVPALLLAPAAIVAVAVLVVPFWLMAWTALTDLSYADPDRSGRFVGIANFARLATDDVFGASLLRTTAFAVAATALELVAGFGLALLLVHAVQRRRWLLTALLVPMMLAPVAVGLMWRLLLQGDFGVVTWMLRASGLLARDAAIFSNASLVMPVLVAIDVWQWTPFVTLILLAALLGLPRAPFEAATMDGAGPWRRFVDVTLPLLRPVLALVVLLRLIDAFKEFDKVWILTGGGPGDASELLSLYAYRVSFQRWDLGYGAAVAVAIYGAVLVLCTVLHRLARSR